MAHMTLYCVHPLPPKRKPYLPRPSWGNYRSLLCFLEISPFQPYHRCIISNTQGTMVSQFTLRYRWPWLLSRKAKEETTPNVSVTPICHFDLWIDYIVGTVVAAMRLQPYRQWTALPIAIALSRKRTESFSVFPNPCCRACWYHGASQTTPRESGSIHESVSSWHNCWWLWARLLWSNELWLYLSLCR